jgi:DNA-binding MarR family transcriptional regulator/GNAT superfamily N-acetyltransferase
MTRIDVVRRFNRTYTQRIGALDESFLGLGLPLGLARLIYEIGPDDSVTVLALRLRLGLDSGQLARQLRSLQERNLVALATDPTDRRRRLASLTDRGVEVARALDHRSEELAAKLLEPLTERQQQRLSDALATADLLVRAATVEIEQVDPRSPLARAAVSAYFLELDRRFAGGFDVVGAQADDFADPDRHEVRFVLATSAGDPVACGVVRDLGQAEAPGVAEIKRMWVAHDWRGAGLGARLLRRLEDVARDLGHREVRLDTNLTLTEAVAMYERAGYVEIERYNDNPYAQAFFAKRL